MIAWLAFGTLTCVGKDWVLRTILSGGYISRSSDCNELMFVLLVAVHEL
jgi:hypothetical protein